MRQLGGAWLAFGHLWALSVPIYPAAWAVAFRFTLLAVGNGYELQLAAERDSFVPGGATGRGTRRRCGLPR